MNGEGKEPSRRMQLLRQRLAAKTGGGKPRIFS
jgi:hypothetical protein